VNEVLIGHQAGAWAGMTGCDDDPRILPSAVTNSDPDRLQLQQLTGRQSPWSRDEAEK